MWPLRSGIRPASAPRRPPLAVAIAATPPVTTTHTHIHTRTTTTSPSRHQWPPYHQCRRFHDYFVTHLPSSSLHPDSRSAAGPSHKLPRHEASPHSAGSSNRSPAHPPMVGASRDMTVVRIPLKSAKHHFGAAWSRGQRPYNEDAYQAGTIEMPAFARRRPLSLQRNPRRDAVGGDSASGDPQVFYFGVFDGHGGSECSEFLREKLHGYIEGGAREFGLKSTLQRRKGEITRFGQSSLGEPEASKDRDGAESVAKADQKALDGVEVKGEDEAGVTVEPPTKEGGNAEPAQAPKVEGDESVAQSTDLRKAEELERTIMKQWKELVGGYFRRFKPEFFSLSAGGQGHILERESVASKALDKDAEKQQQGSEGIGVETVLEYAFLRADYEFVYAQVNKDGVDNVRSDAAINQHEILGKPSRYNQQIGGPTRFKGGSTCSVALISTPTPMPYWHPASPATLVTSHVGDTRILLCETATGHAVPTTSNHHPNHPMEAERMRRYAATFVTDSFGEERVAGLANTRSFGDMASKRIGVSAEPEITRIEMSPAQYAFMVLVSDGISGTLGDQEIVDIVKEARTPEQGAKDVVGFATEVSSEGDNATCLVVRMGGWERRSEGGVGSLGTKEMRDWRRQEALDPRTRLR